MKNFKRGAVCWTFGWIFFFQPLGVFPHSAELEYCLCDKPLCDKQMFFQSISVNLFRAQIRGIDLENPVEDARFALNHNDYRYLTFGDYTIRFSNYMTSDIYLHCMLGRRIIEGIEYSTADVLVIDGNEDHLRLVRKLKNYVTTYNAEIINAVKKGKVKGVDFTIRPDGYSDPIEVERLKW